MFLDVEKLLSANAYTGYDIYAKLKVLCKIIDTKEIYHEG
jgi:hypothetical protein